MLFIRKMAMCQEFIEWEIVTKFFNLRGFKTFQLILGPYCLRYIQQGEFKKKHVQSASVILKFSRLQGGLYNQRFFSRILGLGTCFQQRNNGFCNEVLVEPLS